MTQRILDHASVRVRNVERSRRFYEDILGLSRAPRPDLGLPGVWYALGEGQLHLIQCDHTTEGIDPTNPHCAIQVEDLDAVRRELKEAGIEMLDFGGTQLWVHDPDGHTIELCARTRE